VVQRTCAVVAAAIVTVTAGCGSTGSSVGTHADQITLESPVNGTTTGRAKAVKFAECMRTHGVSAFPDPDASGALTIDAVANTSSLDTNSAAFKYALDRCKDLEPPGFTGQPRSAQQQKAALEFARCIRDNGVPDFPDPGETDPLVNTNRIPSAAKPGGINILNAAMRKCAEYSSAAGVRGST
jgi:hypothetical protein